jgi:hypothetical protein
LVNGEFSNKLFDCSILEPVGFDRRKITFTSESFLEKIKLGNGVVGAAFESGFRVDPTGVPTKVRFDDKVEPRDFHEIEGINFVSQRAKDLIEEFEPDVHQFEPVDYIRSDGTLVAHRYAMFVCQRLDTDDRERTTGMALSPRLWSPLKVLAEIMPEQVPSGADLNEPVQMVFSLRQIGSAHLWRDKHLGELHFMSSELLAAIEAGGLEGLAYFREEFNA